MADNAPSGDASSKPITVLYVEDEPANLMAMQAVLAPHTDIELIDAADDLDAMEYLEEAEEPPDVVLMDQGLGHITGTEVIEMIRDKYGDEMKFVLCTGLSHAEATDVAGTCGAVGVLCKPYKPDEVVQLIRKTAAM